MIIQGVIHMKVLGKSSFFVHIHSIRFHVFVLTPLPFCPLHSGSTLLEAFLEDSLAMLHVDLLLIAYMSSQPAMGMAVRCLPINHLMQNLHITHHTLLTQVTEDMIRDTTV